MTTSRSISRHLIRFAALVLLGCLCLVFSGSHASMLGLTLAPPACGETTGRIERPSYRSAFIETNMVYSIYLPPCYDQSDAVYPSITLLHGSNDDDHHWLRLGLQTHLDLRIMSGAMPPVIVILPFGNWIANQNQFGIASWENVFMGELMPLIEAHYRVSTARAHRVIGGISRGGFWAFQIALRHPERYSAIGGHSAFFDRYHAPAEYNPLDLVLTLSPETAPRIALDRGKDDYAAPGLDLMSQRLTSASLPHTYTIHPEGQHNNEYWRLHVGEYLDFYAADWLQAAEPTRTPTPEIAFVTNTPRPLETAAAPDVLFITNTPPPDGLPHSAKYVLLPVVAFPSRRVSLTSDALKRVLKGEHDPRLVISSDVAITLATNGYAVNSLTEITASEEVNKTLWRDRTRWTLLPFDHITPRQRVVWVDEQNPLYDLSAYPLAFESDTPNYDPARLTRVMLSGVTAMTRRSMPIFDAQGMAWASEGIAPVTRRPDFFHTSNEVSFVEGCPQVPPNGQLLGGGASFCSKPEYFEFLTNIGTDIVELSGNHNNDYGYSAYLDTLAWYRANNIQTVGGGATLAEAQTPLRLDHNGNRLGWVTCNPVGPFYALASDSAQNPRPGAAACDRDWLRTTIDALKAEGRFVIMTVQYWEFDQHPPTPEQRSDFYFWAGLGADAVIGTQAHFPQTYDFLPRDSANEAFIHYGLGNFLFDQGWWAGARFFLDELYVYDGKLQFVDVYSGIIDDLARPRLMTPDERENFLFVLFDQFGGF